MEPVAPQQQRQALNRKVALTVHDLTHLHDYDIPPTSSPLQPIDTCELDPNYDPDPYWSLPTEPGNSDVHSTTFTSNGRMNRIEPPMLQTLSKAKSKLTIPSADKGRRQDSGDSHSDSDDSLLVATTQNWKCKSASQTSWRDIKIDMPCTLESARHKILMVMDIVPSKWSKVTLSYRTGTDAKPNSNPMLLESEEQFRVVVQKVAEVEKLRKRDRRTKEVIAEHLEQRQRQYTLLCPSRNC